MERETEAATFTQLITLRSDGADEYVGVAAHYPWGRVYGGLIVAQALRAAGETVPDTYRVHSLHAYFIRAGVSGEPVRYEVDRIRDGKSFVTRRVVARQSGGAILNLSASFQGAATNEVGLQVVSMPDGVPHPDELEGRNWSRVLENKVVPVPAGAPVARNWIRVAGELPDDPLIHACELAYASDDVPCDASVRVHPDCPPPDQHDPDEDPFFVASLDHAVWFHRPFRANEWLLHDLEGAGLESGRGLSFGRLFRADGTHVASVTQEALVRTRRN